MLLLINCCNKRGNHAISQNWRYFRSRKVFFYTLLNQCNTTDKRNHTHKRKRCLAVISHSTRFKEFLRIRIMWQILPMDHCFSEPAYKNRTRCVDLVHSGHIYTVDSRYLEFDGTMETMLSFWTCKQTSIVTVQLLPWISTIMIINKINL
jgi:hypothetical protein